MEAVKLKRSPLSLRRQCELLCIPRSSLYYATIPEKPEYLKMMSLMDTHLTSHPTEGGPIDGGLATRTGISVRTKACKKDVQADGARDHLSQKKSDEGRSQSIQHSLSIEGLKNRAC
jgi:putative transposase